MMERLTEKQSAGYDLKALNGQYCNNYCDEQSAATCRDCAIYQAIQKLAHYENMEEDGKLLELTCKPGDTVYIAKKVYYAKEIGINEVVTARVIRICSSRNEEGEIIWCIKVFERYGEYLIPFEEFGKTVFLTEQEANEALERMK